MALGELPACVLLGLRALLFAFSMTELFRDAVLGFCLFDEFRLNIES